LKVWAKPAARAGWNRLRGPFSLANISGDILDLLIFFIGLISCKFKTCGRFTVLKARRVR